MSEDEKQGAANASSDNKNADAGNEKQPQRDSRMPPARRKKRRPQRNSRIPKPENKSETREVEEQSLGPGRKKRIFKRRKSTGEKAQPEESDNKRDGAGSSEDKGTSRRSRGRGAQGRSKKQADSRRSNRNRQRDGQPAGKTDPSENRNRRRRGRGGNRRNVDNGGRDNRQEDIAAFRANDTAPDGSFGDKDYSDIDTRSTGRGGPSYALSNDTEMVTQESFFSGRKGEDFASMTASEIDFLKPHEADDEEFYDELPAFDPSKPQKGKLMDIVGVKTHRSGVIEPFDCEDLILDKGDEVIVETDRGLAIGEVMVPTTRRRVNRDVPRVFRVASTNDMRQRDRNLQKAAEAFSLCQKSIVRLKLVMKLVEVMYLHGGNKAVFYFMAEGRVDFRQLVKELAKELHIRVEMRQIGVRDASRMIGGIGTCGLKLCCTRYIREFAPVSIRMAKDQDLVLNPEKVSGQCGRLMCCLSYEEEVYKEKGKSMPRVGKMVETPEGCGRVRDRDILRGLVRVELEGEHGLKPFEITDIRPMKQADGGKGRKRPPQRSEPDAPTSTNRDSDAQTSADEPTSADSADTADSANNDGEKNSADQ